MHFCPHPPPSLTPLLPRGPQDPAAGPWHLAVPSAGGPALTRPQTSGASPAGESGLPTPDPLAEVSSENLPHPGPLKGPGSPLSPMRILCSQGFCEE